MTEKPPELHGHITASRPHGQGVLKRIGIEIFQASLWTDEETWSMDNTFALSIRYAHGFASHDLIEKTLTDMHRLEKLDRDARDAYAAAFDLLFRNVRRDDVITALYVPDEGTSFFHNATPTGIADISLSRRFFDIWFSPRTSEPALRADLLAVI